MIGGNTGPAHAKSALRTPSAEAPSQGGGGGPMFGRGEGGVRCLGWRGFDVRSQQQARPQCGPVPCCCCRCRCCRLGNPSAAAMERSRGLFGASPTSWSAPWAFSTAATTVPQTIRSRVVRVADRDPGQLRVRSPVSHHRQVLGHRIWVRVPRRELDDLVLQRPRSGDGLVDALWNRRRQVRIWPSACMILLPLAPSALHPRSKRVPSRNRTAAAESEEAAAVAHLFQ